MKDLSVAGPSHSGERRPVFQQVPAARSRQASVDRFEQAGVGLETGERFRPSALRLAAPERLAAAQEIQHRFAQRLGQLAGDTTAFHELMAKVYGAAYDREVAERFRQLTLEGDTDWMPAIEFKKSQTLLGGYGAYDSGKNVVYLNEDLLGDLDFAAQVYGEEVGHFIDTRVNTSDTVGDEGELFRRLLAGEKLSSFQVAEIRAENDKRVITVDGRQVEVEFFLKKLFKGIKKAFKKIVPVLGTVFSVMSFIPGLNVVGMIGSAAINVYGAIKRGDWAGALLGVAGAVAGGAGAIAGKAASAASRVAARAHDVLHWGQTALDSYKAARNGDWLGAIAGVAGGIAGSGAKWAEKIRGKLATVQTWAERARAARHGWAAARRGDYLTALGVGASVAADLTPAGSQAAARLIGVSKASSAVRSIRYALESGNYAGATQIVSSMVARSGRDPEVVRFASAVEHLATASQSIQAGNYGGAANALWGAASSYGLSQKTRAELEGIARQVLQAGDAFDAARNGDFVRATRSLTRLAGNELDERTRFALEIGAQAFENAEQMRQDLSRGHYLSAFWRLMNTDPVLRRQRLEAAAPKTLERRAG